MVKKAGGRTHMKRVLVVIVAFMASGVVWQMLSINIKINIRYRLAGCWRGFTQPRIVKRAGYPSSAGFPFAILIA